MKKKLVLMTSALMAISLLAGCGSKHVHNWGEVVYEWSADHTSCTATRVCQDNESHKETETKDSVYAVTKEAKCEEDGSGRYTVTFDNEAFGTTHFDITLEQTGHDWGTPTYTWADDLSTCYAKRVCLNDENHFEDETAFSTVVEITPATCETDGVGTYTATFTNTAFETQIIDGVVKGGHDYVLQEFIWDETPGNFTAIARYVCSRDESHTEDREATVTSEITTAPTCEDDGIRTYTATCGKDVDIKTEVVSALNHNYGEPVYIWNDDYTECTAKVVCANDENHVIEETATAVYSVISDAEWYYDEETEESGYRHGVGCFSAKFSDPHFQGQEIRACIPYFDPWAYDGTYNSDYNEGVSGVVVLPDGITKIDWYALGGLGITKVFIPDSVLSIEEDAFEFNDGLSNVIFKGTPKVTKFGKGAFSFTGINYFIIPDSVSDLGEEVFEYCNNLKTVTFPENPKFDTISKALFAHDEGLDTIEIPNGIKTIGEDAFCFSSIQNLVFKEGTTLETIEKNAFRFAKNLTNIVLPGSVQTIKAEAFKFIKTLETVTLNEGTKVIEESVFEFCDVLSTINLPSTITYIGTKCFQFSPVLSTINFAGTKAQWGAITKGEDWNYNTPLKVVHCSDGDVSL